jgi:hypothetical protein
MGSFLQYASTPKGGADAPVKIELDPRGQSSDGFVGLLREERARKEAEEEAMEDLARENDFSKMNYLGKSIVQESLTANLFGLAEDYFAEYDPAFDPDPYIDDNWPDWRKEAVAEAKNAKHAEILTQRTEEQDLYNKEGEYHGGVGTALNLAGAIINPENFLLGVGEVSALSKLGLTGAKRVAAGAAIGSLSNTAQEAVILANNKSRDKLGLLTAAGFGAAFGAAGSFFDLKGMERDKKFNEALGKGLSNSWKRDLDLATGDVKVNADVFRTPDAKAWDDAVELGSAGIDNDGTYVVQMGNTAASYNTKAQATAALRLRDKNVEITPKAIDEQVKLDYDAEIAKYEKLVPRRKGGKWSSIGLEGLSSKNPVTRFIHSLVVEDASGTGGKNVATHSAALKSDMYAARMRSMWHTARHQYSKQWAKETQPRNWKPWDTSAMDKFDDAVIAEVQYRRKPTTRPTGEEVHPVVKKAADALIGLNDFRYKLMREKGVLGYDTDQLDNLYIKHKWDGVAMSHVSKARGREFVVNLLRRAILNGDEFKRTHKYAKLGDKLNQDYMERTATHMANSIFDRFTRRPDTVNMARAGWLTKADQQDLKAALARVIENPADMKHVLSKMDGKDSRMVNELLSQIDMDINYTIDGVAVRDILDTNLGASMDTEIRRSAGKSAMAEIGFEDQAAFLEFTEKAGRWNRENTNLDARGLERENIKNQKLWNLVMGENLERDPNTTMANVGRGLRKASTLASLNQVGFAQLAETGRLAGSITVRGMIKQIPYFGKMLKRMKNGTFKDAMLNDIEAAFGVRLGDNEILNHPMLLAESGGVGITKAAAKGWMADMDTVMNKGLHVQGYLNGMNYVMKAQHRMHARGYFTRLWEDLNNPKLSQKRINRYADMGLSADDLTQIKSNMDRNTEVGEGWFGQQRPTNINLVKFDAGIREKLAMAYWKNQSQAIQRNIGGETSWWMENSLGKVFSQFRTFPLVAIEKQTLHDLKHMDVEAFTTAVAGLGFAALAYSVKTYANSFGLDARKRKQYLKNRLTPEKIFAGASAWSGQAAIFPDVMRTAGDFGIANPWAWTYQKGQAYRDYYREKGLDLGAAGAAGSMIDSAYRFATGVGQAALTPADLRADTFKYAVRIAPFGNNLAVKAFSNLTLEDRRP